MAELQLEVSLLLLESEREATLAPALVLALEGRLEPLAPPPEALRFPATLVVSPDDCFFFLKTRSWTIGH
jgi:hypothetical protein